jgi:TonB family protein
MMQPAMIRPSNALMLAALCQAACATASSGQSQVVSNPHIPGRGGMVGTIIDADTGAQVSGAYVLLVLRKTKPFTIGALSAADGEFDLAELEPGVYELQVEKNGYHTSSTTNIEVTPDKDLLLSVKLTPGDPKDGRSLAIEHLIEPPVFLSGPNPGYTTEALRHGVQGLMIIPCVITVEGWVRECRVRQGLPYLDQTTINALQARQYKPARRDGEPIAVTYTFKINMTMR